MPKIKNKMTLAEFDDLYLKSNSSINPKTQGYIRSGLLSQAARGEISAEPDVPLWLQKKEATTQPQAQPGQDALIEKMDQVLSLMNTRAPAIDEERIVAIVNKAVENIQVAPLRQSGIINTSNEYGNELGVVVNSKTLELSNDIGTKAQSAIDIDELEALLQLTNNK